VNKREREEDQAKWNRMFTLPDDSTLGETIAALIAMAAFSIFIVATIYLSAI
jgi:hypothetical protein